MLGVSENSACTFHIRWSELGSAKVTLSKDRLKWPISPFYKWVSKNSLTAIFFFFVELYRQAQNDKVELI